MATHATDTFEVTRGDEQPNAEGDGAPQRTRGSTTPPAEERVPGPPGTGVLQNTREALHGRREADQSLREELRKARYVNRTKSRCRAMCAGSATAPWRVRTIGSDQAPAIARTRTGKDEAGSHSSG